MLVNNIIRLPLFLLIIRYLYCTKLYYIKIRYVSLWYVPMLKENNENKERRTSSYSLIN